MGDQVEMEAAAPVQLDEVMLEATVMELKETTFVVAVEGNANGHHVAEGVEQEQAVEEAAPVVVDREGMCCFCFCFLLWMFIWKGGLVHWFGDAKRGGALVLVLSSFSSPASQGKREIFF